MIGRIFKGWALILSLLLPLSPRSALGNSKQWPIARNPIRTAGSGRKVTVTLAPAVEQALQKHFPGFHVADSGDFSQYIGPAQMEAPPKLFVPFACVGDFDGNGLPDVALMLKNSRRRWLFVAFHQTYRGTFRPYRIDASRWSHDQLIDGTGKVEIFFEALPLRKYFPESLHLKQDDRRDGIHSVWDEEASRLFYFRNGRYRWLQTSD